MKSLKRIAIELIDSLYCTIHKDDHLPSLQSQMFNIMEYFDFERVVTFMNWDKSRRVYSDNGEMLREESWLMVDSNHNYSVPTETELRDLAKLLLSQVIKLSYNSQVSWISTGPFKVVCRYGILELMCVIESYSYD